ncbi:MAG: aldehyde dehydrogenase (NADP(+)) [Verrucomicrobia bacterium]|nr:aldehyde dehydrogenase (NADP(+)) [Verrucomicrobiota bacterium]
MNPFSLLGFRDGAPGGATFCAFSTAEDRELEPVFHSASAAEADLAVELAVAAAPRLAATSGAERGALLRALAAGLEAQAAALAARAHLETALPLARCQGEIGRTCGQLRLFATEAESGRWADARIELAQPDRQPLPKPDHRSLRRPLGPVAVFGASNFPFAFSTLGGDTAAALAAGNPVVVKAHPAHPGTAAHCGQIARAAVREAGLPEGTFSLLFDAGHGLGAHLVRHPGLAAVGFTGSRRGGLALMELAARRPRPIPVFAEMSAVNPVFLLPGALAARGAEIATGLAASIQLGVGQFCTNPGLVLVPRSAATEDFLTALAGRISAASAEPMLTRDIHRAYVAAAAARAATSGVRLLARGATGSGARAEAQLFATTLADFRREPALGEEIFGPCSLVIECADLAEMRAFAEEMEGSLASCLFFQPEEIESARALAAVVATRVGRLVANAFPTGVEVSPAIVHGGPYPATSDGASTSVGSRAIERFTRLVCWQSCPPELLPRELH